MTGGTGLRFQHRTGAPGNATTRRAGQGRDRNDAIALKDVPSDSPRFAEFGLELAMLDEIPLLLAAPLNQAFYVSRFDGLVMCALRPFDRAP
jgi:hypothetical protein